MRILCMILYMCSYYVPRLNISGSGVCCVHNAQPMLNENFLLTIVIFAMNYRAHLATIMSTSIKYKSNAQDQQ